MRQAFFSLLIAAFTATTALDAGAVGLGPVRGAAVLGQPLNLPVPMRLDDGESIGSECISAEVMAGEQKLPRADVRVVVGPGATANERVLRVITGSVMQEPVLSVAVSAGCPLQLLRRFVVFADPPPLVTAAASEPVLPVAATPAPNVAASPAAPSAATGTGTAGVSGSPAASAASVTPTEPARSATPAPARPRTTPTRRVQRPAPRAAAERTARAAARPVSADAVASAPAASAPTSAASPRTAAAVRASEAAQPRLKLEAPAARAPALASVTPAAVVASAPLPVMSSPERAASASDETLASTSLRMQAMEAEMVRLRKEAAANRDALLQLRSRLDGDGGNDGLVRLLVAIALLLGLIAVWFAWRLRKLARERQPWWDSRSAMLPAAVDASPAADPEPVLPSLPEPAVPPPRRVEAPETLPQAVPPELSVDEQIDLEQQADFFLVLGQDEAAVDLLEANLRATGGHSPMPYLKLLDIHRRRGEGGAYEQLRQRFNERFNGAVPPIDADPAAGRSLDDYPAVATRLQRHWARPLDAMAYLEALLFRRRSESDRFDLPAFRDLLTLYQLARELSQQQAQGSGARTTEVDLLLPLGDEEGPAMQAVHPSAFERTAVFGPGDVPPRPGTP